MPLIKAVCTADDRLATERQMTRDGLRVTSMCCGDDDGVADKPDPAGVLRMRWPQFVVAVLSVVCQKFVSFDLCT